MDPGKPVLPVNISVYELIFGSKIINVEYQNSTPEIINLSGLISFCKANYDSLNQINTDIPIDYNIYNSAEPYPEDWVNIHTGGGLLKGEHTTYLVVRVYPVKYFAGDNQLHFIRDITVNITYQEPSDKIIKDNDTFDLLIISPSYFIKNLERLVVHKNKFGIRTALVSLDYIYDEIWYGRDDAEKIKLFIKESIEKSGVEYVLLVGGQIGPTFKWYLPIRYSRVVPTDEQE